MKVKKVLFILTILSIIILSSTNVFAIRPKMHVEVYNSTHLMISILMKVIILILFIAYIIFVTVYLIKSKKNKKEKIKQLTKWLIITTIIILILWFTSDFIKEMGKNIKYIPGSSDLLK